MRSEQCEQVASSGMLPAVLVAGRDELRSRLVSNLESDGYIVLEAGNEAEALHVVISQTRPIHILLADVDMNGHNLAVVLSRYRPEMQTFFVAACAVVDAFDPPSAVANIRRTFPVPASVKKFVLTNRLLGAPAVRMIA